MDSKKEEEKVNHNNMPEVLGELRIKIANISNLLENFKTFLKPNSNDELLTRKEVANFLKCDESTIHNWTVKGKLTKYCLGNRTYYKRSDVEKALIPIK